MKKEGSKHGFTISVLNKIFEKDFNAFKIFADFYLELLKIDMYIFVCFMIFFFCLYAGQHAPITIYYVLFLCICTFLCFTA